MNIVTQKRCDYLEKRKSNETSLGYASIEEMEKDFRQVLQVNKILREKTKELQLEIIYLKEKQKLMAFSEIMYRYNDIETEDDIKFLLEKSIELLKYHEGKGE